MARTVKEILNHMGTTFLFPDPEQDLQMHRFILACCFHGNNFKLYLKCLFYIAVVV